MCLIAYAPVGRSQIPEEHLRAAHAMNADAWAIMFPGTNGRLRVAKDISGHDAFRAAWRQVPARVPVAVHFRHATIRTTANLAMAHPFPILTLEDDGVDLAMVHNGVLHTSLVPPERADVSDTAILVRDRVRPRLRKFGPQLLSDEGWRADLGDLVSRCGADENKLLFMRGDGEVFIVNRHQGKEMVGGLWYSNTCFLEESERMRPRLDVV